MNSSFLRIIFSLLIFTSGAFGADVTQVKGNKALINLGTTEAQVGQTFFILSSEGKKIGIVEIKQVKNGRALADILKGRAEVGGNLSPRGAGGAGAKTAATTAPVVEDEYAPSKGGSKKRRSGFLGGIGMHTFAMDIGPTTTTSREPGSLTGMSFSLKGFMDFDMSPRLTIRAVTGLETFTAKTSLAQPYCDAGASTSCTVDFMYLALEGSGHFNYITGKTKAWVGLGYSFLVQMSGKNNIPNLQTSGGTNQLLLFGTGADFALSGGSFIPVAVEYGLFPGSADVKASSMFLRAGYGFTF